MNNKTARVIITFKCNRRCKSCCNTLLKKDDYKIVNKEDLLNYNEIIITGGEPMLFSKQVINFIEYLKENNYQGKIYMYTAFIDLTNMQHIKIIKYLDGITYTLHYEKKVEPMDIFRLFNLYYYIDKYYNNKSFRINIDSRFREDKSKKLLVSDFIMKFKNSLRWMKWKDECLIPEHEEIVYCDLIGE